MPMYWTFNCFLGCIYIVYYIVYIVFLVLYWLSNLEFRLPKKEDQVARIGVMGGGLGNSGNAWKKTVFFIEAFPYIIVALSFLTLKESPLEVPWRHPSRSEVRHSSRSQGTSFETKIFKFRWFLGPSDQNELYQATLPSKIWDFGNRIFFAGRSF